jgi:hypothetical protein
MIRYTKGRCYGCKTAFIWPRKKGWGLANMACPQCGSWPLHQTTHMLKSVPWKLWENGQWVSIPHALYEDGTEETL